MQVRTDCYRLPGHRAVRQVAPVPSARCGVVCLRRMNDNDLTILGDHYGLGHDARRPFGITRADRRQGLHLIGQSGTGKSALMPACSSRTSSGAKA